MSDGQANVMDLERSKALELGIIASILHSPEAAARAFPLLREEDFTHQRFRVIYQRAKQESEAGRELDVSVLVGGIVNYTHLASITTAHSGFGPDTVGYYAGLILEGVRGRDLVRRLGQFADEARNDPAAVAGQLREFLDRWGHQRAPERSENLGDQLRQYVELQAERDLSGHCSRSDFFCWPRLTALMKGVTDGQLVVVAGRTGHGKTSWAINAAIELAFQQIPVLFFSCEMSRGEILTRMAQNIIRGPVDSREDLMRAADQAQHLITAIHTSGYEDPGVLLAQVASAKRRNRCRAVFIDYLQLLSISGYNGDARAQEVSKITRRLKEGAVSLEVPIIALAQLNRSVEARHTKKPTLADLRESGAIEQDADKVLFVSRPRLYGDDRVDERETDLILAKHRNGPLGTVKARFQAEQYRFVETAGAVDDDEREQSGRDRAAGGDQ